MTFWRALFALFLVLVLAWAVWDGRNWRLQAKLTPWAIGIPVAVLAVVVLARELLPRAPERESVDPSGEPSGLSLAEAMAGEMGPALEPEVARRRTVSILAWILGFFITFWLLGFHIGVPLATFLYLRFVGREGWPMTLAITVGSWAAIDLFFDRQMHVFFEQGLLWNWLKVEPGDLQEQVFRWVRLTLLR